MKRDVPNLPGQITNTHLTSRKPVNRPTDETLRSALLPVRMWLIFVNYEISKLRAEGDRPTDRMEDLQQRLDEAYTDLSEALNLLNELDI